MVMKDEQVVKMINVNDGDIVVVNTSKTNKDQVEKLAKHLEQTGIQNALVIGLKHINDIEVIPEERMNRFGWYRKKE